MMGRVNIQGSNTSLSPYNIIHSLTENNRTWYQYNEDTEQIYKYTIPKKNPDI